MDDVQYNAICVDPDNPSDIYVGSDIGMWRSTNGGSSWHYFSDGLPSAAVLDLKLHQPSRLLRASTHGRGVYEWAFKAGAIPGIELYIRHTQLDQGRRESLDDLDDPTQVNGKVHHTRSPDIKLEAPDASGKYKISEKVDFVSFVDELTGPADEITIHTTTSLSTRIYVQVHNRGVIPANRVRVTCLIADCSGGVPALPQGYEENIRLGKKIATATWNTIGVEMPDDVRVGFPQIGTFDLKSDQPIKLTIGKKYCVLALVHHTDDEYSIKADADVCYKANRKAALRSFTCRAP